MNDDELRAIVRAAVDRHFRGAPAPAAPPAAMSAPLPEPQRGYRGHASHGQYLTVVNTGDACVIEPAVPCDHCGYCKSHGH